MILASTSLREIEEESIQLNELKESLIYDYQTVQMLEVEENDGLELEDTASNDDFAEAVEKEIKSLESTEDNKLEELYNEDENQVEEKLILQQSLE